MRGIRVPAIQDEEIAIYVEALYGPEIAAQLGVTLLEPGEDWLVRLPERLTQRRVELVSFGSLQQRTFPLFVKPPNDKSFRASVVDGRDRLPAGVAEDAMVLISEPVVWRSEYRCFCLDGRVRTLSPYLLEGEYASESDYVGPEPELEAARTFCQQVLDASRSFTPRAIVVDVGTTVDRGWAVVEANGAWGAGIYGCYPGEALEVVWAATRSAT